MIDQSFQSILTIVAERIYFFLVKKCWKCARIDYLPDPTLQVDNHYKPFDEVFGTGASEEHMPSLIITKYKKHNIPMKPL